MTDRQSIPLTSSDPIPGNHNDLFEIEKSVYRITDTLKQFDIELEGLFIDADAGFDGRQLRGICNELGIVANFDINKPIQKTTLRLITVLMISCIKSDLWLKEPRHGLIGSKI